MTALAIALGWIGTLAAGCFAAWLQQRRMPAEVSNHLSVLEGRLLEVEHALASPQTAPWDEKRIKRLEDTVSVLALGAGLKQKPPPEQVKG
ncbi:MAG TPA: hypothetical protein VFP65_26435 [Anaeromyxobacteraceae bacterium]|nr:hypothetical protein [Anaeromyxobacteraceae bacterium]